MNAAFYHIIIHGASYETIKGNVFLLLSTLCLTELAQRQNINHCKISNSSILVLLALQAELDSKFQY